MQKGLINEYAYNNLLKVTLFVTIMYDTLIIHSENKYSRFEVKEQRLNTLTGEEIIKGSFENMNITENENGTLIYGSLAKLYFNNNLETLTRKSTQLAIEKLSDGTGINIPEAKIYRIDIATNFIMKDSFENYLPYLGNLQYYKKSFIKNSLYYENSNKVCLFYNKIKEMSRKGVSIPDEYKQYKDYNLRFEQRFIHRLGKEFKQEVRACKLYEETFYMNAIDKWYNTYNSIQKIKKLNLNIMALTKVKTFENQIMLLGFKLLGDYDEVMRIIQSKKKSLSKMQVKRLKDKVKEIYNTEELTEPEELTKELDEKMKMAVSFYR